MSNTPLAVLAINCSLKPSSADEASSTDAMIAVLKNAFSDKDVTFADTIRVADFDIKPGVTSDEGDGDEWPDLRERILDADILVFGGPIWMGQIGSVAKRVLERMSAFMDETDDEGRMVSYGKVAVAAIVGNEDGAHWSSAQLFQSLNDSGYTVPAVAACYWVGEAMGDTDFKELDETPDAVRETAASVANNAAHLARLLKDAPYPGANS